MKIRHKLTGQISETSYHEWEVKFVNENLDDLYEIIEHPDIVLVREIGKNGERIPFYRFDRNEAIKIVKRAPNKYDFVEIEKREETQEEIIINSYKPVEYKKLLFDTYFYDYLKKKITRSRAKELLIRLYEEKRISSLPIDMLSEKLTIKKKTNRFIKREIIQNRSPFQIILFITTRLIGFGIAAIVGYFVLKFIGLT